MSKWTTYQFLIITGFSALLILMNVFSEQVSTLFSFVDSFINPSILIIFFSTILIIWGFSFILLFQEKKVKPLFVHKVWRIMPAIMGGVLFVSAGIFIALGMTVLADLSQERQWILDLFIIYFLVNFYLFVLSIGLRYGKVDTAKNKIMVSANAAVIILFIVILVIPSIV